MSAGAKGSNAKGSNAKRSNATGASAKGASAKRAAQSTGEQKLPDPGRQVTGNTAGEKNDAGEGIVLSPAELRRRRTRNIAIAVTLGALVILFYVMTLARLGSNVMNRPL